MNISSIRGCSRLPFHPPSWRKKFARSLCRQLNFFEFAWTVIHQQETSGHIRKMMLALRQVFGSYFYVEFDIIGISAAREVRGVLSLTA